MGTVFSIASALGQTYAQNKALIAQGKANQQTAKNLITSMNYSFQNLEQERKDAFEATISELEKVNLQGHRQEGSVNAAVNEGLAGGGRTADLIKRGAQADTNRATASLKENYSKKSNEIDINKETSMINTKQQIGSIKNVEAPSFLSTVMNLGTAYLQAQQTQESIKSIQQNAGVTDSHSYKTFTPDSGALGYYDSSQKAFATVFDNKSNYASVLGDIDFDNKFKFAYTNPFAKTTNRTYF